MKSQRAPQRLKIVTLSEHVHDLIQWNARQSAPLVLARGPSGPRLKNSEVSLNSLPITLGKTLRVSRHYLKQSERLSYHLMMSFNFHLCLSIYQ